MDIVVEGDGITAVRQAAGRAWPRRRTEPRDFNHEIDGKGMYVMPGFVGHARARLDLGKAPDLSHAYKLWLAHGVTTVRGVSLSSADVDKLREEPLGEERDRRAAHLQLPDAGSGWPNGPVASAWRRRASGSAGPPRTTSTASSSSTAVTRRRRSSPPRSTKRTRTQDGHRRPPVAERRRQLQRPQCRRRGSRHGHAPLRPLRISVEERADPELSADATTTTRRRTGSATSPTSRSRASTRLPRNGRPISSTRRPITSSSTRR